MLPFGGEWFGLMVLVVKSGVLSGSGVKKSISHNKNIKAQQSSTRGLLTVARPAATTHVADKIHRLVPPSPGSGDAEPGQEAGAHQDDM